MSEHKDKSILVYLGIAGLIGVTCISITALMVIFVPQMVQQALIPVIAALAAMGVGLGYFYWRKDDPPKK
jgi:UDP-N-acetylmuramyl pentapeptide phosphotransferase/UDP-N-acetylglucosamine-1-phosphate transferase